MKLDTQRTEQLLRIPDLHTLFIQDLGWDNPSSHQPQTITIPTEGKTATFLLTLIAEKRGVGIYRCDTIPPRPDRQKIERQLAKRVHEHLIIFLHPQNTQQIWQWAHRQPGRTIAYREHSWHSSHSPQPLIQQLNHISFDLEDEQEMDIYGVTSRLRDAFDKEKVTKRFYDAFQKQHEKFLTFIQGLTTLADKKLYASLMLNRLMFIYFIQEKGFLDDNPRYLTDKLAQVQRERGADQFHTFYRAFLLKLFHHGLAQPQNKRSQVINALIGDVPYLNGGLFEPHILEGKDHQIQIPDAAFQSIFTFFGSWKWTLDTRPLSRADGHEINPDILGHIFEKYINRKQMGAYYTKEDITDYITKNSVIPWLFHTARNHDKVAFAPGGAVWQLLADNPDAYIPRALAHGAGQPLPAHIAAGLDNPARRGDWNTPAPKTHALPTEIWRETITRRNRHATIRAKLAAGEITRIEDLITYNLDIRQFARDVIQYAESPDLVRATWKAIKSIKILDPACGSGAFLFAALNILYDLYDACLEAQAAFIDATPSPTGGRAQRYSDFRTILAEVAKHPNRNYFIYKSIIIDNLYGVDIMAEAVEICKLRLFLKLAAQLKDPKNIEPLPDIDFNIRPGNSLIGYISTDEVQQSSDAAELDFANRAETIQTVMEDLDKARKLFREQQKKYHPPTTEDKRELQGRLDKANTQLNTLLAKDYGAAVPDGLQKWQATNQPFNWLAEFFGILQDPKKQGFDVIIGNPPYLEASKIPYTPKGLKTLDTRAVHAWFVERSNALLSPKGTMSMILPMSLVSTQRMKPVQDIIEEGRTTWYSNYARRPAKLFEGAGPDCTIYVTVPTRQKSIFTTGHIKWRAVIRDNLIPTLAYTAAPANRTMFWVPKFQSSIEPAILQKILDQNLSLQEICVPGPGTIHYRGAGGHYWKVFSNFLPKFLLNGKPAKSTAEKTMPVKQGYDPIIVAALLSSTTFYWWYTIQADIFNMTTNEIKEFKTNPTVFHDPELLHLGKTYLQDLQDNSETLANQKINTQTQQFNIHKSKPIIDQIDAALALHYTFTPEQLDFIQNYDIKFRLSLSSPKK